MARSINELIGTNTFDENFKNAMRDYYSYGFKCYDQFYKDRQTIDKNRKILEKILGEHWEFKKTGMKGRYQIVLRTAERDMNTPINELYFLHNLKYIGHYLNYLLDLDSKSRLRSGLQSIPPDEGELTDDETLIYTNEVDFAIIDNWFEEINYEGYPGEFLKGDTLPVRINRQLDAFCPDSSKGRNLWNRTAVLDGLGVVCNLSSPYNVERRNRWLKSEWNKYQERHHFKQKRYFNSAKTDLSRAYWMRSPITMETLLEKGNELFSETAGKDTEDRFEDDFQTKFQDLCSFYTQYFVLGEIGSFLNRRMMGCLPDNENEPFKFKHNYIQKSLYDYNLLDILIAVENTYICWVSYSHGINLSRQECIIIPLQIRVSVANGREYVMYYDIERRKLGALRIEFIDRIIIYRHVQSIKPVERSGAKNAQAKRQAETVQEENALREIKIDAQDLKRQIILARQMLPSVWGTEISDCLVDDNWEERVHTYRIRINYSDDDEQYITVRAKKESRKNADVWQEKEIKIKCFPTKELRNWLRSFYVRMESAEGMDDREFDVDKDVESLWNLYFEKNEWKQEEPGEDKNADSDREKTGYEIEGTVIAESEGHAALFHELFSKHAVVLADSILACSHEREGDFHEILKQEVRRNFSFYAGKELEKVTETLAGYALDCGVIGRDGVPRFTTQRRDYLYEVLPLTKIECRWLITVLRDPVADIFLPRNVSQKLIDYIRETALYHVKPFEMDCIYYFDRYNAGVRTDSEIQQIRKIYRAICNGRKIRVKYKNWKGDELPETTLCPAWMEYSKRDDVMRIWAVDETGKICIVNVPRMTGLEVLHGEGYNLEAAQEQVRGLLEKTMTKLTVEFYEGKRNLPDRILTEFSLWKKKCVYDPKSKKFAMKLHYSTYDEKEILIRLLSYGAYIKVSSDEKDNYVCTELKRRIARQRDLFRTMEHERD